MKSSRLFASLLVVVLLAMAAMGTLPRQAVAQEATQVATAAAQFDLKTAVKQFVTGIPDNFYGIKPADALKAMQSAPKPLIVDLREAKEITDGGYIDGAISIPIRTLTANLDKLGPKDSAIILYCASGHRGGIALTTLHMLGYTNVVSVFGGLNAWKAAKLPVSTGSLEPASKVLGKPEVDTALFAVLDKFVTSLPDGFYGAPVPDAFKSLQASPKPFLLDVREPAELTASGYIDGMVNIPLRKLFDNLDKLPADFSAAILDYCAIGHRGSIAMMTLRLLGYTNVKSIGGGFNNWVNSGMPIVKPPAATAAAS